MVINVACAETHEVNDIMSDKISSTRCWQEYPKNIGEERRNTPLKIVLGCTSGSMYIWAGSKLGLSILNQFRKPIRNRFGTAPRLIPFFYSGVGQQSIVWWYVVENTKRMCAYDERCPYDEMCLYEEMCLFGRMRWNSASTYFCVSEYSSTST